MGNQAEIKERRPPPSKNQRAEAIATIERYFPELPMELWDGIASDLMPLDITRFIQVNHTFRTIGHKIMDKMVDAHFRSPLVKNKPYRLVAAVRAAYPNLDPVHRYALCGMVVRMGLHLIHTRLKQQGGFQLKYALGGSTWSFSMGLDAAISSNNMRIGRALARSEVPPPMIHTIVRRRFLPGYNTETAPLVLPSAKGDQSVDLPWASLDTQLRMGYTQTHFAAFPFLDSEMDGEAVFDLRLVRADSQNMLKMESRHPYPIYRISFSPAASAGTNPVVKMHQFDLDALIDLLRIFEFQSYERPRAMDMAIYPEPRESWLSPLPHELPYWPYREPIKAIDRVSRYWLAEQQARRYQHLVRLLDGGPSNVAPVEHLFVPNTTMDDKPLTVEEMDSFLPGEQQGPPFLKSHWTTCGHDDRLTLAHLAGKHLVCDACAADHHPED
jgi:hypothetical protein